MNKKNTGKGPAAERRPPRLPLIYPFAWREEVSGESEAQVQSLWVAPALAAGAEDLARGMDLALAPDAAQADLRILPLDETQALAGDGAPFGAETSPERYYLDTTRRPFTVGAATVPGARLALHSLKQLRLAPGRWAAARVWDAPALRFRSVHCYLPARADIPFFKRWLAWLAALKYNAVFLEIGGGMEYKRHPEINAAWQEFAGRCNADPWFQSRMHTQHNAIHSELAGGSFLTQAEVRDLAAAARGLHLDVIPEVQSLSHAYYLCCAHREIAEDPAHLYPDTYCPYHPDTYPLLFDVIDEVAGVFQPKAIIISHDEWVTIGRCPRCREKHPSDILYQDVKRIHNYLLSRKIDCFISGDKFMNIIVGGREYGGRRKPEADIKGETYQALDKLAAIPVHRQLLILDWYWSLDPFSETYFYNKGFHTIFGNFEPLSFNAARLRAPGVFGAMVPTWQAAKESAYARHGVIQNALLAANPLWWKNFTDHSKAETYAAVKGRMAAARSQLGARAEPAGAWQAVVLPPGGAAVIPVREKAGALRFVHAMASEKATYERKALTPPPSVGRYVIRTAQREHRVELTAHLNILPLHLHPLAGDANTLLYWADVAEEGWDAWGRPVRRHALTWINPDPQDEVIEVVREGDVVLSALLRLA